MRNRFPEAMLLYDCVVDAILPDRILCARNQLLRHCGFRTVVARLTTVQGQNGKNCGVKVIRHHLRWSG